MLSTEELEKLEAEHKKIAHLVGKGNAWECVFRKPNRAEYKRFRSMLHNPSQQSEAQEYLARAVVVYPSREAFDQLLDEYPAIVDVVAKQITDLAGTAIDESVK